MSEKIEKISNGTSADSNDAVEHCEYERFLHEVNAAYAQLKRDPQAWKEELAERQQWDATLADGLERE
jgi:hypothetical protein